MSSDQEPPERLIAHEVASLKRQMQVLVERHDGQSKLSPWTVLRLIATIESPPPDLAQPLLPDQQKLNNLRERAARLRCDSAAAEAPNDVERAYENTIRHLLDDIDYLLPLLPDTSAQRCVKCGHADGVDAAGTCLHGLNDTGSKSWDCPCECVIRATEPSPRSQVRRTQSEATDVERGEQREETCWHCADVLAAAPKPRCENCPDKCDVEGCDEPGCATTPPTSVAEAGEPRDYTDGGRLPTIKEMSGSINFGGRVVFDGDEQYVVEVPDAAPTDDGAEGELRECPWCVVHPHREACSDNCRAAREVRASSPPVSPTATDKSGGGELSAPSWLLANEIAKAVWEKRVYLRRVHKTPAVAIGEAARIIEPFLIASSTATAEQTAREIVRVAHNITRDCLSRTCFRVDCSRKDCWGCDDFNAAVERVTAIQSEVATVSPGTEPWFDAGGCAWEIRRGVDCVECPHCAFTFDAIHTSGDSNGYECPNCEGCPNSVSVVPPDTEAQAREVVEKISERLSIERVIAKDADWNRGYNEAVSDCIDAIKSEQMQVELTTAIHSRFAAGVKACVEAVEKLSAEWEKEGDYGINQGFVHRIRGANEIITALSALAAGDSLREKSTVNDSRARDSHGDSTPVGDQSSGVGTDGGEE